jgi:hypothetical protein
MEYRSLAHEEVDQLIRQGVSAEDWQQVEVAPDIKIKYVRNVRLSGHIRLGAFDKSFEMPGGICKHSGVYYATLHNVTIGNNCCIENIKNYIANYEIGDDTFIENVDIILVDKPTAFGNGAEAAVLNETGGREVTFYNQLSAHEAYIEAMYRHRPMLIERLKGMAADYARAHTSDAGRIGSHVTIVDSGYIKNVMVGDYCKIEGSGRLKNGSINSNAEAPVHIGYGVVCDDFIISSGSQVEDGTMLSRCFVGQSCKLGHTYSASDSLFFSNCQGENGEACAIFAGPFTVTHHKSTLLIAGMFSFMNAGSGSNQSNHMYKLGPIHQGIMERGAKTTSDSYILWPARVGAFSLVMGRHVNNADTSDMPFSYLIEQRGETYLVPGVNLRSVGTIRDVQKWPKRDRRTDPDIIDQINYNLLSPYTIQKMLRGIALLKQLRHLSGETSDVYAYQSAKIRSTSLERGLQLYDMAIHKFIGNSLISRLSKHDVQTVDELRQWLLPSTEVGQGEWVDLAGLIAPKTEVERLMDDVEHDKIRTTEQLKQRFVEMHRLYYEYEWTWAYGVMLSYYHLKAETFGAADIIAIVEKWKKAVVDLDRMVYADARKEFSLTSKTGFGADGSRLEMDEDFEQVRGDFENNPFVTTVLRHIDTKAALGDATIEMLQQLR